MADKSPDPMALWRDMITQWERASNTAANQLMSRSEFSQGVNSAMTAAMSARGAFADVVERYLVTFNLPSRADVAALGERMQAIETQLARLTALMEAGVVATGAAPPPSARRPSPPRTRKPQVQKEAES